MGATGRKQDGSLVPQGSLSRLEQRRKWIFLHNLTSPHPTGSNGHHRRESFHFLSRSFLGDSSSSPAFVSSPVLSPLILSSGQDDFRVDDNAPELSAHAKGIYPSSTIT